MSVFRIRRLLAWFLARVQKAVNSRFCSVLSRDLSWVPSTVCGSWCARPLTRSETLKDISFSSAGFSFSSVQFSWLLGVLITVFLRRGRTHRDRLICHGVFTYMTSRTDTMTDQSGGAERLLGDVEAGINFS